jgi:predicted DNA-binding protein (MmcQ/YjbR family)
MDQHQLKAECLALPGSQEEFPFGDEVSVFKVAGKMFAACRLDELPLKLSLKCDPDIAVQLRAAHPAIAPGYYMNKRHWNTVTLDGSQAARAWRTPGGLQGRSSAGAEVNADRAIIA